MCYCRLDDPFRTATWSFLIFVVDEFHDPQRPNKLLQSMSALIVSDGENPEDSIVINPVFPSTKQTFRSSSHSTAGPGR